MPRCFVTACKSGSDSQRSAEKRHFFRAPRDSSRLQVWQRAIPRLDKQLTSSCVVCDLHFEDNDLVKEFVHNINGDVVIIPRDNWALNDDAVPRLFPNYPSYLWKPARKRKQPAVRRAPPVKVRKRQGDGDVTSLCDDGSNSPVCGAIASLYSELVDLAKTNQKIQGWSLEVVDASVVVYKLKMENAVPRVDKAVVVSRTLTVSATKSDYEREAAALRKERDDLTAILSSQRNNKSAAVNKVAEPRRKCIQVPEDSGNQLHKTVNEQPRMIRLKEDAERSAKKLQQEISNMTQARVQLKKLTKEESERHRRQRTERIREVRALRIREQQKLTQMARMERQNTLGTNVSQRRVEDALEAKNRLEAAHLRRLENRAYDSQFDSVTSRVKDISPKPAPAGTNPFRLKRIREDYDTVIWKNIWLQADASQKLQEECKNLKEDLSKALAEKTDFRARLDSVECEVGELRFELGMKTHELDALISFYSNREKLLLRIPQALPLCVSCYMELRMVELQEANAKLQQESCRLQASSL
ncbi:hypothetical protein HPB49_004949 [Dermacentor silvarum]|uniref:Uncharacterized protein n=1 Tax=Dermacentor silvarum TaxID=543639 RepID=A0ACB8DUR0_DERSI|nr:hypothetical protein HPB49_004949 [Dermacentor silvarum]